MSPETLAYPFLFVSIFFESFILVTILSKPARASRARVARASEEQPRVAIIVPCYNEAGTVGATVESLLALEYPADKLEVVLVDDGSTDATPLAMARYENHPQVRIIRKENGGKHTALNAGIAATNAEIVGCLDADSFVAPDALREILLSFDRPEVAASTAAMSVHKPKSLLERMQNAEYIFGITLRHALASVNGIYVTPGPFSLYRRSVIEELGGFSKGHQTEDLEMALRIQKAGHWIENAPRARVYTKAPKTLFALIKQRTRWTSGFLRNITQEYRGLIWSRQNPALGMITLPIGLMAIGGGIFLFALGIFLSSSHAIDAISIRLGVPLGYALMPHSAHALDWYYLPSSLYLFLGAISVIAALSFIAMGKRISRTPGSLALGLISYVLLYGFIAPLWLMRAAADVTLGKHRRWR